MQYRRAESIKQARNRKFLCTISQHYSIWERAQNERAYFFVFELSKILSIGNYPWHIFNRLTINIYFYSSFYYLFSTDHAAVIQLRCCRMHDILNFLSFGYADGYSKLIICLIVVYNMEKQYIIKIKYNVAFVCINKTLIAIKIIKGNITLPTYHTFFRQILLTLTNTL